MLRFRRRGGVRTFLEAEKHPSGTSACQMQVLHFLHHGSLSELWELVMDREAWRAAIHGVVPGESQGRRSLVGCHLWGHTELDTTEAT